MGGADYLTVPGDYDGDGSDDRQSTARRMDAGASGVRGFDYAGTSYQRGGLGTTPVPGAYDYDEKTGSGPFTT